MASIKKYKNKDNKIRYSFQVYLGLDKQTGKKMITTRRGFKTKKEANLEASKLEIQIAQGDLKKQTNIKFLDVYKEWFPSYKNTVRVSTWARSIGMFKNHILTSLGNKKIETIKPNDVQIAVNKWFKFAPNNSKKWYYYSSMVFDYAMKQEYISKNPCKMVTLPRRKPVSGDKTANFWTKDQLMEFFKYIDKDKNTEKFTLFRVLAFTGIRRGECLALTWGDINFNENTLRVNKTLTQGVKGKQIVQAPKTRKGRRTIILDKLTIKYLKEWHMKQRKLFLRYGFNTVNKSQLVFTTNKNTHKSLNTPGKWLSKIIKDHNLKKITVHGFRHTHASALFAAGASIKEVQERLGHEDVQTTMNIYTHVTNNQNKDAVKKLTNYLNF